MESIYCTHVRFPMRFTDRHKIYPMKSKAARTIPIKTESELINCEDCHHFSGSAWLFKFECSKGHAEENGYSFKRKSCPDASLLTRDELIFRRFKFHSAFTGDAELKKKRASVRRTASSLLNAASEFEKVLTADQLVTIKAAAAAFGQLGRDIERAGVLAKQHQKIETEERERPELERKTQLANEYFGIAGEAKVFEICEDLIAFSGKQGRDWFKPLSRDKSGYISISAGGLDYYLNACRRQPGSAALLALKHQAVHYLEELREKKEIRSSGANIDDFERFRVWRADRSELERIALNNPTIALLK